MIICVNVLIYQKMISLSSMISGKCQGLKLKVKDSLKPLWTRFLSNPKRLRPTACEVCTVNSITGGVLTWSVGILQTLRCTLLLAELAGSHETLLQPAARYHSMSAKRASLLHPTLHTRLTRPTGPPVTQHLQNPRMALFNIIAAWHKVEGPKDMSRSDLKRTLEWRFPKWW